MTIPETETGPAAETAGRDSQNSSRDIHTEKPSPAQADYALAGDALADASRLIALCALSAETAARRHEWLSWRNHMRKVRLVLDEAFEIATLAGRLFQ